MPRSRAPTPEALLDTVVPALLRVTAHVLDLSVRAAAGDLAARAEIEALAAIVESRYDRGLCKWDREPPVTFGERAGSSRG